MTSPSSRASSSLPLSAATNISCRAAITFPSSTPSGSDTTRCLMLTSSVGTSPAFLRSRWNRLMISVRIQLEQWKRELEYWFAVGLARLQLEVFGTVEKPPGVDASMAVNHWDRPKYKALKALCGRIKFRSPGHTSLSTLGFGLILGVSGVLVLLNFADVVVPWLLRGCGYGFWEWEQSDMLKLLERELELERCLYVDTEDDRFVVTGPVKGVRMVSMP